MSIGYIYKLISPNNKIYIGQTINLSNRKRNYKSGFFKEQIKLWNNCQAHNWNPLDTFEIIEEILDFENKIILNEREKYWINFYDSFNNGLNCSEGGNGNVGHKHTLEAKEKMRQAKLGKKLSEEHKQKISISGKGHYQPQATLEQREKIRQAKLGRKQSEETIKKRIEKNTGKKRTQETKDKIGSANKGRKHTEETNEKNRLSHIGLPGPNKGKKMSEEQKQKISTTLKNKKKNGE